MAFGLQPSEGIPDSSNKKSATVFSGTSPYPSFLISLLTHPYPPPNRIHSSHLP
jgi:hypothetical protein